MEKPKCRCGLDMVVIQYKGYYETFNFWGFDKNCKCTKNIRVRDFKPDEIILWGIRTVHIPTKV